MTNCTGPQRFVHGSRRFPEHHQRMFRLLRKQHRRPDLLRTLRHLQLVWVCHAFAVALFSKKTTVYLRACVLQMGLPNRGRIGGSQSLGSHLDLQGWRLRTGSNHSTRLFARDHWRAERQLVARSWNPSRLRWLHRLQRQHQPLLRHQVSIREYIHSVLFTKHCDVIMTVFSRQVDHRVSGNRWRHSIVELPNCKAHSIRVHHGLLRIGVRRHLRPLYHLLHHWGIAWG